MFKKFTLVFLFIFLGGECYSVLAQTGLESQHLADHKPLMNEVWKTFDTMLYKVNKKNGKTIYTPFFPSKLAKMDGMKVELQGYMVPLKTGLRHNRFLLSVLPVLQCIFCGQNGIPPMVEITLANNDKIWLKENPITLKGYVKLNEKDRTRVEIFIQDASIVK
ncbi:hypothetical protein [Sphingobacterium multivorum]|uniref:hypothetical protein n=1 Tax=Sphingobacterium multivorum TaxID=28454 RepID=UPI0028AEDA0A|nr:hypothetical protein [Sphingobacterium multivorum]